MDLPDSIIDRLEAESVKNEPMVPRTLRLTPELDKELQEFCASHPRIKWAVVARQCVEYGWEALKAGKIRPE